MGLMADGLRIVCDEMLMGYDDVEASRLLYKRKSFS